MTFSATSGTLAFVSVTLWPLHIFNIIGYKKAATMRKGCFGKTNDHRFVKWSSNNVTQI